MNARNLRAITATLLVAAVCAGVVTVAAAMGWLA